jgi:hypothetical protein
MITKKQKIRSVVFGSYELIAEAKRINSVQNVIDLRLNNNGHYTGAHVLLTEKDYTELINKLALLEDKNSEEFVFIDKNYWLQLLIRKKAVGQCYVIQPKVTDHNSSHKPREVFFPKDEYVLRKIGLSNLERAGE